MTRQQFQLSLIIISATGFAVLVSLLLAGNAGTFGVGLGVSLLLILGAVLGATFRLGTYSAFSRTMGWAAGSDGYLSSNSRLAKRKRKVGIIATACVAGAFLWPGLAIHIFDKYSWLGASLIAGPSVGLLVLSAGLFFYCMFKGEFL